ncbi:C40 family peptidase [Anaerosporobacter sp.]|uniref:C40 family peptidase n=1 Tax=Anaerosporobacter sp. TaxID=1872529 RepID=UPI00286EDFCB|nr:C40 family peptidase [Anaerosporobacter sp.]
MKKAVWRRTSICLAATFVLCTSSILDSKAISFTSETGVAGIELSLGDNTSAYNVVRDSDVVNILSGKVLGEEVTTDNNIVSEDTKADSTDEAKSDDAAKEDTKEETKEDAKEEEKEEPVSEYANVGISIAPTYVNVRKEANTDSEILGKLYKGCAATILETKGEWVKIKSGNVKGYINAEYLAIGFDAEELVEKYGTKIATVNTTTLKVREKKSTDSRVLTMIPIDESYVVLKEYDEWVKVSIDGGSDEDEDNGVVGYVSKEFVNITVEFETAISVEEEEAKKKQEEEARQAELEQEAKLKKEQEEQKRQQQQNSSSNNSKSSNNSNSSSNNSSKSNSNNSSSNNSSNSNSSNSSSNAEAPKGSATGSNIAAYAQKFVGNRYVYGGTSLTNGADCSGFVMSVYKSFGYSLPRTSSSQATVGTKVDMGSLQPGDLVFYAGSSGHVNHVAIYIGGGKVVHASNPRSGIKISSVNYRTPYTARRIVR